MDPAEALLDKIFSLADLEARSADEMNKLATELEEQRKGVNISQVAGSAVSTVGSAGLLTAGLLVAGPLVPFLAVGGTVATVAGLLVSGGSEVYDGCNPKKNEKEKQIYEKIETLEKEIQTLIESLVDEGEEICDPEKTQEEYVTERILRALAKRYGLTLDTKVSKLDSEGSKQESGSLRVCVETLRSLLIGGLLIGILKRKVVKRAGYVAIKSSAYAASKETLKRFGSKASSKAFKRFAQGTFGLVFSSAELIYTIATVNNYDTDKSKSLRERAEKMKTHAENMKRELDETGRQLKELVEVKNCIESKERSPAQKETLKKFAKKKSKYDDIKKRLEEDFEDFLKLVDMFKFLKEKIDEQRGKVDRENIDIIFVAHGSIEEPLTPASSLLPLSTIQDVVLYSPWNCALMSDAAYGVATGRLEPKHRVFICGDKKSCKVKHEGHQPTKLPGDWNSMKDAAERQEKIPTITVSPLTPKDGAWKHFELLQDEYGRPGKNRILIPFILPGVSEDFEVLFSFVTLALSLVLYYSCYKATVHLAACLGKSAPTTNLPKLDLNRQYSYTIDETAMESSVEMLDETPLSRCFKDLFG